jgi:hypothetical protein
MLSAPASSPATPSEQDLPVPTPALHAHHQAEDGDQIVGAQHARPQRVAAAARGDSAGHGAALEAARSARELAEEPRVRLRLGDHGGGLGAGVPAIVRADLALQPGDGGQHERRAEPFRQPAQCCGAPTGAVFRHGLAGGAQLLRPHVGVLELGVRQPLIDLLQVGVGLGLGEFGVEHRRVALGLETLAVARKVVVGGWHGDLSWIGQEDITTNHED